MNWWKLKEAAEAFVAKVEDGRALSKQSYAAFKEALESDQDVDYWCPCCGSEKGPDG